MVHLSGPLPGRDVPSVFYVAVNIDRGCEGEAFLLDLGGRLATRLERLTPPRFAVRGTKPLF